METKRTPPRLPGATESRARVEGEREREGERGRERARERERERERERVDWIDDCSLQLGAALPLVSNGSTFSAAE